MGQIQADIKIPQILRPKKNTPSPQTRPFPFRLTVRFLVSGTGTGTTEDLWLATSVIGNEEGSVVLNKGLFELVLGVFVNEFLVVGDYRLGDGLSDSIDLGSVTTTGDADTDVDTGEFVKADDEDGFVDLGWTMLENPIFKSCRIPWYLSSLRIPSLFIVISRSSIFILMQGNLPLHLHFAEFSYVDVSVP